MTTIPKSLFHLSMMDYIADTVAIEKLVSKVISIAEESIDIKYIDQELVWLDTHLFRINDKRRKDKRTPVKDVGPYIDFLCGQLALLGKSRVLIASIVYS